MQQQNICLDINLKYLEITPQAHTSSTNFINHLYDYPITEKLQQSCTRALGYHLYTFKLKYNEPSAMKSNGIYTGVWYIRKRVKDFFQISYLFRKIKLFQEQGQDLQKQLEHYPDQVLQLLSKYLMEIVSCAVQNPPDALLRFLQFSYFQFGTQVKYHQSYLKKKTGGRYGESMCARCGTLCRGWNERLFLVTSEAIIYTKGHLRQDCNIREVIYFDYDFSVRYGKERTGNERGIIIKSSTRRLELKAADLFVYLDFLDRLKEAVLSSPYTTLQRFDSFAPIREGSCKWYISGEEYFFDLFEALSKAQRSIYITGWWLSPEFHLKRPVGRLLNSESRLDKVLKQVADKGVSIMIVVYNEIPMALGIDSEHTKLYLESLSPNIKVYKHPNQTIPSFWTHHEKSVIIDQHIGFMGGLDICFGRMDNKDHLLFDFHLQQTQHEEEVLEYWPGIDYANSRIRDFTNVKNHQICLLPNKRENQRMPWQDIALCINSNQFIELNGDPVVDMTRHFIQLWNFVTIDINFKNRRKFQLLQPHKHSFYQPIQSTLGFLKSKFTRDPRPKDGSLKQSLIQDKQISSILKQNELLPNLKRGHLIDYIALIEKQLNTNYEESKNDCLSPYTKKENLQILKEQSFCSQENQSFRKHEEDFNLSLPPPFGFDYLDMIKKLNTIQEYEQLRSSEFDDRTWRKIENQNPLWDSQFVADGSLSSSEGSEGSCQCQMLRSVSQWSIGCKEYNKEISIQIAYISLIAEAENFIYIENQFFISSTAGEQVQNQIVNALITRIKKAAAAKQQFRVVVILPLLPGFEGIISIQKKGEIDGDSTVLKVQLHWQYATIHRGDNSLIEQLRKDPNIQDPFDYIQFYSLRQHGKSPYSGIPISEMIYVHSKLIIIDDEVVLIGSANINDRSMMGSRDSEIAMVVHDQEKVDSRLAGKEMKRAKFAHTLRKSLYESHMGMKDVVDPLDSQVIQTICERAHVNTLAYRKVFACYPDDTVTSWDQFGQFKISGQPDMYDIEFAQVKGYIVEFPLRFLEQEDLNVGLFQKEKLCPAINFT